MRGEYMEHIIIKAAEEIAKKTIIQGKLQMLYI